jgi:hypothetical protein
MVIDMWRPKFLRLPEQIYNKFNNLAMSDSSNPQFDTLQNIESLRMHYKIEDSLGSALLGANLIVTDEQGFLRGEVCPYGVSSVSVWT